MAKGRKVSEKTWEKFFALLREGHSVRKASAAVGISDNTVYTTARRDPEFRKRIEEARDAATDLVEHALLQKAITGNVTAIIFWLLNRRPDRWRDRRQLAVTGETGGPLQIVIKDKRDDAAGRG